MGESDKWSEMERSAYRAAFFAWRDVINESLTGDDPIEWYIPPDKDGLRQWGEWRNTVVQYNMDELDKWTKLAERLTDWSAVMELSQP